MAEVLAVATSVIAVLQITDRVTSACKFYIENVKEGSSHLRAVLLEISTLRTIFKNLDFLIARDTSVSTIVGVLAGEDGPIEGCRRAITELENSLPTSFFQTAEKHKSKKRQLKAMVDALAWPLKESKARKLLEVIASYKTTIILAVTIEPMWVITFLLIDRPANIPMAVTRSLKADKLDSQDVKDIKMKTSAMHDLLNGMCGLLCTCSETKVYLLLQIDFR